MIQCSKTQIHEPFDWFSEWHPLWNFFSLKSISIFGPGECAYQDLLTESIIVLSIKDVSVPCSGYVKCIIIILYLTTSLFSRYAGKGWNLWNCFQNQCGTRMQLTTLPHPLPHTQQGVGTDWTSIKMVYVRNKYNLLELWKSAKFPLKILQTLG